MPLFLTELCRQEDLDKFPGDGRPCGPAAHANDIHVIVFDSLPRGELSVISAARTPGTLLAQIDAPTPLPHKATPRSSRPAATAWASGITKSG